MTQFLKFKKFKPPPTWAANFEALLNEFRNLCASDTYLTAVVSKLGTKFVAEISARSVSGHIGVRAQAKDLETLVKRCMAKLYQQLRIWRETRLKDLFPPGKENIEVTPAAPPGPKPKALVVEDNAASARVMETIMTKAGYESTHVDNTQRAVVEIANHRYDVILMDWCLPFMTGGEVLEVAASIFARERKTPRGIPVVTCSGIPEEQIDWPESKFFKHVEHWDKTDDLSHLVSSARRLIRRGAA